MTLIVSFAFPLAISTIFILMKGIHSTFNLISLMGLAIGVGMLTDNSVVVIDNIYNHIQEEKNSIEAAFIGTNQVFSSVLASTMTSIIVFLPIIFTKGIFKENVSRYGMGYYFFKCSNRRQIGRASCRERV